LKALFISGRISQKEFGFLGMVSFSASLWLDGFQLLMWKAQAHLSGEI